MDKHQFVDYVITEVRNLPTSTVLSSYMTIEKQKGKNRLGLCPFHNDTRLGSFVITDSKGIWYCFACHIGGDSIKFVSHKTGMDYLQSAFHIALNYGIITPEEYDEYYKRRRFSRDIVINIERRYEEIDKAKMINDIADEDTLDKVFNIFIQKSGGLLADYAKKWIEGERPLHKYDESGKEITDARQKEANERLEHARHLLEERKLSLEEIESGLYFSFPTRFKMYDIGQELREKFASEDILEKIPGFYYDMKKKKYTFAVHKGIAFGIQDALGKVSGIQIRLDTKGQRATRYIWFSSSFANFEDDLEKGTSSGSPVDVVYPKVLKNSTVFITEGRFKAQKIATEMGSIAISVQGVGSWKGVLKELQRIPNSPLLKKIYHRTEPFKIKCVLLAFDADMAYKVQVFQQAKRVTDNLVKEGYTVFYLYWNDELGKGIDDIFNNNHREAIRRYEKDPWDKDYANMLKVAQETEKKELKDIPQEIIREYFFKVMKLNPLGQNEVSLTAK